MPMTPQELKVAVPRGMLSFPLTDFDAGGAGEFFSLTPAEFSAVIATAVQVCGGKTPIISGTGYGTRTAIEYAREAERLGADGLLLMPPYLVEASQEGLRAHITAICSATRLGVIVYNRANCRLVTATTARLAAECPNLIGFKDGVGDLEMIAATRAAVGDRLIYINGMPTAETYAPSFKAAGVAAYSSAVFNFIPRTALRFLQAVQRDDHAAVDALMRDFFVPYVKLRARQPGYAVSIVKAGAAIVGRGAGKVRPPLSDCTEEEVRDLRALIEKLGPQD